MSELRYGDEISTMNVQSYLSRLNYTGTVSPDAGTLRALHRAHMFNIPFENLDIHLGRPIVLDEEAFFDKIIARRRGGFCYELNGLFAALLRGLGFDVTMLSARVYQGDAPGPEFDHMALLVQCEERWLADVGFGDSFVEPLRLDESGEHIQRTMGYRIESDGDIWRVLQREQGGAWTPVYQFTLQPRQLSDYAAMCLWQQTSPASHFTRKRICSMATPGGRVTLSDLKLIVTDHGTREERMLSGENDYALALRTHFGIHVT